MKVAYDEETIIAQLTSMSELELRPIMEALVVHLDREKMNHLLRHIDYDDELDELKELLGKAANKLEEIEGNADNIQDEARSMVKKIRKAI